MSLEKSVLELDQLATLIIAATLNKALISETRWSVLHMSQGE